MKHTSWFWLLLFSLSASFGQVRHDLFIPVGAGDSLDATYYLPAGAPPAAGYPAIIFVHGFGLSKDWDTLNCFYYSSAGYASFCFSLRGHGASSGHSTIMGGRERADFQKITEYVRGVPGIDAARIGIVGGSQGGLHGLWAIADRLPVAAVSTDVIVPDWASDLLMNGCIRRTFMLLTQTPSVRYGPVRDSLWNFLRTDAYDSLLAYFPPGRDLDSTQLFSGSTPLLLLLKWQDHYFSATGGLNLFQRYAGTSKLYAGTQGHFSDRSDAEQFYQSDLVTRWLSYFLKGTPNGILNEPRITYAWSGLPVDSGGAFTWTRETTHFWPLEGVRSVNMYPSTTSLLSFTPSGADADSFLIENIYQDSTYTFDTGYIEGFTGPNMEAALPTSTVSFETLPLLNDEQLAGAPRIRLFVASSSVTFPLHTQIYEVDTAGLKYFVTRVNLTARHWIPGTTDVITANGIPHAHRFRKGNRIRIEFTNIDRTNRRVTGTFPFVLPLFASASVTVYNDRIRASHIELPLIALPSDVAGSGAGLISGIVLQQNYPNPFNPTTVIGYSLSVSGFVRLRVFDILGREVAQLVNGNLGAGSFTATWDASAAGVASGLYFYKLEVTSNEGDRTMVLGKMVYLK